MPTLTGIQEQVLRTTTDWRQERGEWPSLGDLAKERRCTRRAVVKVLKALERKGMMRRRDRKEFEVLPAGYAFLSEDSPW